MPNKGIHIWKNRKHPKGMLGKKHSEDAKKKMSESHKGLLIAEETKRKISKAHQGKKLSEEHKEKDRIAHFGKKATKETRRKMSLSLIGEKNPAWLGGKSFEPYTAEFNNRFKRAIRKRDNQICMLCGIHREKLNKALDVHHINYDKKLSVFQNCVSLCNICHNKTGFNRKQWMGFFQALLSEKYGYQYSKTNEIIMEVNTNGNKRDCEFG